MALSKITNTGIGTVDDITLSGGLNVGTIKEATGTNTAIAIDSSGRVTMANTTQIDMWRLTADFGTNSSTVTGWGQSNSAWEATVGASMAESSGIFTFPNTGLYKITGTFFMVLASGDISAGLSIDVSSDSGSNYDTVAQAVESYGQNTSAAFQTLINVTDASTFRVLLRTSGFNSGTTVAGNSTINISCLMFERITDAQ